MPQTAESYRERLRIPVDPTPEEQHTPLYTSTEMKLCNSYQRIVIGERGPYVEVAKADFNISDSPIVHVPSSEVWRFQSKTAYYVEYRTVDLANVKVYCQRKPVDYADYKPGMFYINPFDLFFMVDGVLTPLIDKLR